MQTIEEKSEEKEESKSFSKSEIQEIATKMHQIDKIHSDLQQILQDNFKVNTQKNDLSRMSSDLVIVLDEHNEDFTNIVEICSPTQKRKDMIQKMTDKFKDVEIYIAKLKELTKLPDHSSK